MAAPLRACLVIAAGVFIHLTLGTLYTFGNLLPYITSYIRQRGSPSDLTNAECVWISALAGMGQGATMFFGGLLEKRLGPRWTVLCGAWFMSLGLALTYFFTQHSFAATVGPYFIVINIIITCLGVALTYFAIQHSFAATVVTYGLMFGFGVGVAYAVPISVGMRWFPNRKGLVSGCVVAGFGGGAFIFDQIQTAYINPNNLDPDLTVGLDKYFTQSEILDRVPKMFLILAASYAAMQLVGVLLLVNPPPTEEERPILAPEKEDYEPVNQPFGPPEPTEPPEPVNEYAVTPKGLFRERAFYILWFIFLLNGQGVSFVSSLYKDYGQTFIKDDRFLAWVGALAAVCNAGGRIMWGSLADRYSFKVAMMCLCCLFAVLLLTLGVTSLAGRWMFLVWVCLLFLAFSGSFSLMPTACVRSFGQAHYTKNYGLLFTSQVITSPVSAVLTSQLKSAIGWYGMFYMVAAFSFISFILSVTFKKKMPDGKDV